MVVFVIIDAALQKREYSFRNLRNFRAIFENLRQVRASRPAFRPERVRHHIFPHFSCASPAALSSSPPCDHIFSLWGIPGVKDEFLSVRSLFPAYFQEVCHQYTVRKAKKPQISGDTSDLTLNTVENCSYMLTMNVITLIR